MMMEPWQSWAALSVAGAGLWWYYAGSTRGNKTGARAQEQPNRPARQRQEARPKRNDSVNANPNANPKVADTKQQPAAASSSASTSVQPKTAKSSEKPKNRKTQSKPKTGPEPVPVTQRAEPSGPVEEEADDFDFAERLSAAKKGTTLASSGSKDARSKTVKQKAASVAPQGSAAVASSSATDFTPSGKDVSDMLEAPQPGPSILRVTEPANPAPAKKPQTKQAPPPQETKKQRQNRRKAEEKKLQREQEEEERRVLLERQMRTAREARGEPAKNGVKPAAAPANNIWTQSDGGKKSTTTTEPQLLDTFEQDATSTASSSNAQNSNASTTTTGTNWGDLPTEDEQIRLAVEDSSWNTVPTKRNRKKTAGSVASEEGGAVKEPEAQPIKEAVAAPVIVNKHTPTESFGVPSIYDNISNPNDSDWAVV